MAKRIPKPLVPCSNHGRATNQRTLKANSGNEKPLRSSFYKSQKSKGLCARCPKPAQPNRVLCQEHLEESRAYSRKVTAALKLYNAVEGARQ